MEELIKMNMGLRITNYKLSNKRHSVFYVRWYYDYDDNKYRFYGEWLFQLGKRKINIRFN